MLVSKMAESGSRSERGFLARLRGRSGRLSGRTVTRLSMRAALEAQDDIATTLLSVRSETRGLTQEQANRRLVRRGYNRMTVPGLRRRRSVLRAAFTDLQSLSLLFLTVVAFLADPASLPGVLIAVILILLTVLGALVRNQQNRQTILALNEMAGTGSSVLRRETTDAEPVWSTVPSAELVTGDIVQLGAGYRVPADVRLIESHELYLDQSLITGNSEPERKFASGRDASPAPVRSDRFDPPSLPNICLTGSFVLGGSGTGVVVATGEQTWYGSLARALLHDNGLAWEVQFGAQHYLPRLLLLLPVAFLLRAGFAAGQPWQLATLAAAAAFYLLPELLPGLFLPRAVRSEQESGAISAMAGWLTSLRGRAGARSERFSDTEVELVDFTDGAGSTSPNLLRRAWVLSDLNTSALTAIDRAVLDHVGQDPDLNVREDVQLLDEIPFDLRRGRYSLVVAGTHGQHMLLSRGGPEEIIAVADSVRVGAEAVPLAGEAAERLQQLIRAQAHRGNFVQLIGCRFIPPNSAKRQYGRADERGLTVEGLLVLRARVDSRSTDGDAT